MRFQLEIFGIVWAFASEVSPIIEITEEPPSINEVYSSTGFTRNEEPD